MKKTISYFLGFMFLFFVIPVVCSIPQNTKSENEQTTEVSATEQQNVSEDKPEQEQVKKYDYEKYKTIRLLHTESNQVEELGIDEYLYGVVSSEMPASYEIEALKAQAVVARTYTIYQAIHSSGKHENADICDSFACCQAWISKEERLSKWKPEEAENNWNKIVNAVDTTSGKIITYNKEPINAFFHSNSGGVTESSLNIWGGIDYPYLKSVETAGEDGYSQYNSEVKLSKQELLNKIKTKYPDCEIDYSQENCIQILENTTSGRIKTIKFGNKEIAGTEARTLLGLKSTNFSFAINGEEITFSVKGYGHGVGMSQTGADSLAKSGSNYEEIIKHFYTNVEIIEVNSL
ncbi:MAG: stage II sporulation protein D [Clostridia bacterium]|nr:stage II sporulation protein D [Clostridia bacterium]